MTYQRTLKAHLAAFKVRELAIEDPGIFRYRDRDVPCDHILPWQHSERNLTDLARPLVQTYERKDPGLKRHRYFHHLNSSQAFAFNLFFPYFSGPESGASALLRALGQAAELMSWIPEAIPDKAEASNIDAIWRTSDGCTTFCEVKLSETGFGKAVADERRLRKLAEKYQPVLKNHVEPQALSPEVFFESYQFMRNVWHMIHDPANSLVFLLPRGNRGLWTALQHLMPLVVESTRNRIRAVAVEDLLRDLSNDAACPEYLRAYAGELGTKYVCT